MKTDTLFLIIMEVITVASIISNALSRVLINRQQKLIQLQSDEIKRSYANTDEILEYCLRDILKQAIADDVQDYETADRCFRLIKSLNKNK